MIRMAGSGLVLNRGCGLVRDFKIWTSMSELINLILIVVDGGML